MKMLQELLARSAARHHNHLCPRQVLGVRIGLLAGKALNIVVPQAEKRLFAFVECDGCGMGGIAVASGCFVERRTLRVLDYGKLAATFVDTHTGQAVRIHPHPDSRQAAQRLLPDSPDSWHAQLEAYQVLPDEQILVIEPVRLAVSMEAIISQPGLRADCTICGEEIINDRQVIVDGKAVCQTCAGESYFIPANQAVAPEKATGKGIPLLTIIGKSGSGKTTLLEKLVRELTSRGYRLATIKHHSHRGFEIDIPGKDSWRFSQAGSRHVIIAAPDRIAGYRQLDHELSLEEVAAGVTGVDLILVEGYKQANQPAIEVVRTANDGAVNNTDLIATRVQRIAIVSDLHWDLGVPLFGPDDVTALAGWIEERFNLKRK